MPIDPSIPLRAGVGVTPVRDPLETFTTFQELGNRRRLTQLQEAQHQLQTEQQQHQLETARQAAQVKQQTGEAIRKYLKPDGSLDLVGLSKEVPALALPEVMELAHATQRNLLEYSRLESEMSKRVIDAIGGSATMLEKAGFNPTLYRTVLDGFKLAKAIPEAQYQELIRYTTPEQIGPVVLGFKQAAGIKPNTATVAPGEKVINLDTKEEIASGGPKVPTLGTFEDYLTRYAGTLNKTPALLTPAEIATAKRQYDPPAPQGLQLVPVYQNGVQTWVPEAQAQNQPTAGAAPSESERKAAGYHGQMKQAITVLDELEATLTATDIYQIQSLPQEGFMGAMNRSAMSDNAKRYVQAFNQFTEARLRPASGAAISDAEYARDRATYGKQYGETPALSTQRHASRTQALQTLQEQGGNALRVPGASGGANNPTDPMGLR